MGVSVGNGVIMAANLFVSGTLTLKLWDRCPEDQKRTLAIHLRKCLQIKCMWKFTPNLKAQVFVLPHSIAICEYSLRCSMWLRLQFGSPAMSQTAPKSSRARYGRIPQL